MLRVGIYSGKLYSQEDYDNDRIHECAIAVSPSAENQEEAIRSTSELASLKRISKCVVCMGCPESQRKGEDNE